MERLVDLGRVRALGVSNFGIEARCRSSRDQRPRDPSKESENHDFPTSTLARVAWMLGLFFVNSWVFHETATSDVNQAENHDFPTSSSKSSTAPAGLLAPEQGLQSRPRRGKSSPMSLVKVLLRNSFLQWVACLTAKPRIRSCYSSNPKLCFMP